MVSANAETAYLTRSNIVYPGTVAQATAAAAKARIDLAALYSLASIVGGTIPAGGL